jgi:hypothetical protein
MPFRIADRIRIRNADWMVGVSDTWEAGMGEDRLLQEVLTEPGARGCLLSKGISSTWEAGMGEDRLLQEVLTEPGAGGGQARLQHVQHDRQHRT